MISISYLGFKHIKWRLRIGGSIRGLNPQKHRQLMPFKIYHRHITCNNSLDNEGYQNDNYPPRTGNEKEANY
jgi:hypothetical protein